ncbi:hypothetical protein ACLVWU_06445 [Bdellovibrio sp. HCB290]|uniref:hypothetical protein n=1 Tax=Bdellovibrio sp. HCB290 TaxID=3394356 RepID=UPI0039B3A619
MQNFVFIFTLIFSTMAHAHNCTDITGLYQMTEGAVVQYQVEDCSRLIRWGGFTTKKGEIVISPEKQVYSFSGTPECNSFGKCQSATVVADGILISLNYEGYVKTKEHGLCQYRSTLLSLNAESALNSSYEIHNCDDGYTGTFLKVFPRIIMQN